MSADSAAGRPFAIEMYTPPRYKACMNTPIAQLSKIPVRAGHLGRMAPSKSTAPNIRKNRKVSGSAYGSPSFAPINPDAHKITNKPGAARIVNCSIGLIAEGGDRTSCEWTRSGTLHQPEIGLVQSIRKNAPSVAALLSCTQ